MNIGVTILAPAPDERPLAALLGSPYMDVFHQAVINGQLEVLQRFTTETPGFHRGQFRHIVTCDHLRVDLGFAGWTFRMVTGQMHFVPPIELAAHCTGLIYRAGRRVAEIPRFEINRNKETSRTRFIIRNQRQPAWNGQLALFELPIDPETISSQCVFLFADTSIEQVDGEDHLFLDTFLVYPEPSGISRNGTFVDAEDWFQFGRVDIGVAQIPDDDGDGYDYDDEIPAIQPEITEIDHENNGEPPFAQD